jgi:hypothetical protein
VKKVVIAFMVSVLITIAPGSRAGKVKTLGTDPTGDAPPALDLTYVKVGRAKSDLEVRIGVNQMLPVSGGYPAVPGIEWIFQVGSRIFLAEAVANVGDPDFYLFEIKGDSFEQLDNPEGTYDPADGFIAIFVPLKQIGARSGSHIIGATESGPDADSHVHLGPQTYYSDTLTTTKHYVVP